MQLGQVGPDFGLENRAVAGKDADDASLLMPDLQGVAEPQAETFLDRAAENDFAPAGTQHPTFDDFNCEWTSQRHLFDASHLELAHVVLLIDGTKNFAAGQQMARRAAGDSGSSSICETVGDRAG